MCICSLSLSLSLALLLTLFLLWKEGSKGVGGYFNQEDDLLRWMYRYSYVFEANNNRWGVLCIDEEKV